MLSWYPKPKPEPIFLLSIYCRKLGFTSSKTSENLPFDRIVELLPVTCQATENSGRSVTTLMVVVVVAGGAVYQGIM